MEDLPQPASHPVPDHGIPDFLGHGEPQARMVETVFEGVYGEEFSSVGGTTPVRAIEVR